jgi:hypothetical protein
MNDKEIPRSDCKGCENNRHDDIHPQVVGYPSLTIISRPIKERHREHGLNRKISMFRQQM